MITRSILYAGIAAAGTADNYFDNTLNYCMGCLFDDDTPENIKIYAQTVKRGFVIGTSLAIIVKALYRKLTQRDIRAAGPIQR